MKMTKDICPFQKERHCEIIVYLPCHRNCNHTLKIDPGVVCRPKTTSRIVPPEALASGSTRRPRDVGRSRRVANQKRWVDSIQGG